MKSHLLLSLALATCSLSAAGLAFAVQPYWHDQDGHVIRDGSGGCVQTKDWKPELASVECGAKAAEAPTPTPAPAPVARPAPAPAPAAVAAPAMAAEQPVTLRGDTSFALGSDELSPAARAELDTLAKRVLALESLDSIEVAGHTDNRGAAAFNQALSERRAQSVKRYLMEHGVDAAKVTTTGYGMSRPVADNNTAEGRAANRRVDITIHGAR